jgi:hypothetical protein
MCHSLGADAVRPGLGDMQTPASSHEVYKQFPGHASWQPGEAPDVGVWRMNFTVTA